MTRETPETHMTARIRALLICAIAIASNGALVSHAQDAGQSEAAKEGRANDRLNSDPSLNNDQSRRPDNAKGADDRAADLHRTHPHAAARCHDGFFTTTRDRSRACSRHGGIDVWLSV
jgi:hypothetical protein